MPLLNIKVNVWIYKKNIYKIYTDILPSGLLQFTFDYKNGKTDKVLGLLSKVLFFTSNEDNTELLF